VDCTLAALAHQQGDGILRRSEARVLQADLVKNNGEWKFRRLNFH
jgi:stress response protein SCP2